MPYRLSDLLSYCLQTGGAELVVPEGAPPAIRMLGRMIPIPNAPKVPSSFISSHLESVLPQTTLLEWKEFGRSQFRGGPWLERLWRVSLARQALGGVGYFKPIPLEVPELSSLSTPAPLRAFQGIPSGLLIFSGPACSGKTTTATSFVQTLCARNNLRVRSLQHVSEYRMEPGASLLHEREGDFPLEHEIQLGLKAGTDVFFLGDLPLHSMDSVLQAAESGALVVATLRAGSVAGVLDRILDQRNSVDQERLRNQLALHLKGIVIQYLLPELNGRSMVPAWEILHHNTAFASAVRAGEYFRFPQILRTGIPDGMLPLDESLHLLVQNGRIAKNEAARIAFESGRFQ